VTIVGRNVGYGGANLGDNEMDEFCTEWRPHFLSVLRIMTGLLFLEHGTSKLLGFPHVEKVPQITSMPGIGGILELIGGALIALGLFTRPVAFLLSGEMAVAYFTAHAPRAFFPLLNSGDAAVLYCFVFLYLFFAGPGPWSIDAMMKRK
jgi:putative oxidoreductase